MPSALAEEVWGAESIIAGGEGFGGNDEVVMGRGSVGRGNCEERRVTRGYVEEVVEGGRGGRRAGSAERWDERPGIWSSRSTYSSESYVVVSALGPAAREGQRGEGRKREE